MRRYDYTENEAKYLKDLVDLRGALLDARIECRSKLELVDMRLGVVERCQDAWMAEALFRRGIPMSRLGSVTIGAEHLEVESDKLI